MTNEAADRPCKTPLDHIGPSVAFLENGADSGDRVGQSNLGELPPLGDEGTVLFQVQVFDLTSVFNRQQRHGLIPAQEPCFRRRDAYPIAP